MNDVKIILYSNYQSIKISHIFISLILNLANHQVEIYSKNKSEIDSSPFIFRQNGIQFELILDSLILDHGLMILKNESLKEKPLKFGELF